jgi:hypothetical protein
MPVWRTIALGTYADVNALREALDSDDCGPVEHQVASRAPFVPAIGPLKRRAPCRLGASAGEIIGRPAFRLSRMRHELDLVVVSAADLGVVGAGVALKQIYARAEALGLALCPAEAGPQLRLQYLEQPPGEFLHVAMRPIATYAGDLTDLSVGNDGGGLLLLGGDGRPDAAMPTVTRFVFVRPRLQRSKQRDSGSLSR